MAVAVEDVRAVRAPGAAAVRSVLLVRLSAMGDVVQALGAVEALHRTRPDWRLTFVTQPVSAPLLRGVPGIGRVVEFARHAGLRGLRDLRRDLRADDYDLALDLQGNWKSALVARLASAREVIGMGGAWRQEPWSRLLLHRAIAGVDAVEPHPAHAAWLLVRALVAEAPFLPPRLVATEAEILAERRALQDVGIQAERPFVVIVVTDPADPRALRPPAIVAAVQAAGLPALCVAGPAEAALAIDYGVPVLRHGRGEVRRLIALGTLVAAVGGRVLGPDQGASHVLAAAGAPTRVVFGAQDPRRTAPPAATVVVHREPPSCSPCRRRSCAHRDGVVCMPKTAAEERVVATGLPPFAAR